jgi:DNA-directed RNA polymerase subunit RPC12/RpoP
MMFMLTDDEGLKQINPDDKPDEKVKPKRRITCEICGCTILSKGRARHERSQRHKETEYIWQDRFELSCPN